MNGRLVDCRSLPIWRRLWKQKCFSFDDSKTNEKETTTHIDREREWVRQPTTTNRRKMISLIGWYAPMFLGCRLVADFTCSTHNIRGTLTTRNNRPMQIKSKLQNNNDDEVRKIQRQHSLKYRDVIRRMENRKHFQTRLIRKNPEIFGIYALNRQIKQHNCRPLSPRKWCACTNCRHNCGACTLQLHRYTES